MSSRNPGANSPGTRAVASSPKRRARIASPAASRSLRIALTTASFDCHTGVLYQTLPEPRVLGEEAREVLRRAGHNDLRALAHQHALYVGLLHCEHRGVEQLSHNVRRRAGRHEDAIPE